MNKKCVQQNLASKCTLKSLPCVWSQAILFGLADASVPQRKPLPSLVVEVSHNKEIHPVRIYGD